MIGNNLHLCLFGILACLFDSTGRIKSVLYVRVSDFKERILRAIDIKIEYKIEYFPALVGREAISGGLAVLGNQFAYQVSVQVHGEGHVCGGGIIGDRFVLTAAHCVLNNSRHLRSPHIYVLAGTTNYLYAAGPPAGRVSVERVFFPSSFHPRVDFPHGDIAVLRLVEAMPLGGTHTNLGMLGLALNYNYGAEAVMTGFGGHVEITHNHEWRKVNDGQLRYTLADVISNEQCELYYPPGVIQDEIHICTRMRTANTIFWIGDNGGPLVQHGNSVIGILSIIPPYSAQRRLPAVYTNVAHYHRMILNIILHGHDSNMISLPH